MDADSLKYEDYLQPCPNRSENQYQNKLQSRLQNGNKSYKVMDGNHLNKMEIVNIIL